MVSSRSGHSVLVIVNGLRPYVEISDPSTDESSVETQLSLDRVSETKDVRGNPEPTGMKLSTMDGVVRPHYRVFLNDTTKVRGVRRPSPNPDGLLPAPIYYSFRGFY